MLLLVTHILKFLILISVQCLFFLKTEVMDILIAKKCYHSVYCKMTLQDTEELCLLGQRMGAVRSSEMPLNSYKLHIMSHKPVVFTVTDVRTSVLTYYKMFEETAEADTKR